MQENQQKVIPGDTLVFVDMIRKVHSDMTRSSPIFSQKRKLKSRESLSNALTSAALPRPFILT